MPLHARLVLLTIFFLTAPVLAQTTGWRGDGTGIYPDTTPPIQWSRISKSINDLRYQATAPDPEKASGQPMADGVIRDWLILGPIEDGQDAKGMPTDAVGSADLSRLAPTADADVGGAKWKPFHAADAFLDFAAMFEAYGKSAKQAAYAHSFVYSPAEATFAVSLNHTGAVHFWINGKLTHKPKDDVNYIPLQITLQKGWNRVLLRVTPSQQEPPAAGMWYTSLVLHAAKADTTFSEKNIRWKTRLPAGEGFGSPIVVGGRIFLLSEPADLVCVDAASGKILWVRSNNYDELATESEKKEHADIFEEIGPLQAKLRTVNDAFAAGNPPRAVASGGGEVFKPKVDAEKELGKLMRKVDDRKYTPPKGQDVGYAGFSPVSDGRRIWAWFATGVTCCYDLDGRLIWRRLDNEGSFFEHGYSVSPILVDGKLIVFMNKIIAFDAATGERLWSTEPNAMSTKRFHGTPAGVKIGGVWHCYLPTGHILRVSDGKVVHENGGDVSNRQQEIPSPVLLGKTIYRLSTFSELDKVTLPETAADPLTPASVHRFKADVDRYPTHYLPWFLASPLVHDGLAYCVNNAGVLTVVDVDTMQLVYQRLLDLDQFQNHHETAARGVGTSPSLAGGRIYLVGNSGATLVIKPGRTYEQLAKNKIESVINRNWGLRTERFVANPAFLGKQMFLRGERYLYCLGE
jgi:hypothetical protein